MQPLPQPPANNNGHNGNAEPRRGYGGYGGYGYGGYGGYGGYSGYAERPVSIFWSKARIQVRRYVQVLGRLGWVLPLTISVGVCMAAWVVSQMPPSYMSEGRMMVSGQIQIKENTAYNEQADNFYGTQIELMSSPENRKAAMIRVQTLQPQLQSEAAKLTVTQLPHASIFVLHVESQTAAYAQAYTDALMEEYIELKKHLRLEKSDTTTLAIQDELNRLDKEMADNDDAMHEFQKANNIGFIEKEGNDAATYLNQLNRQLADLKIEANLLKLENLDENIDRQHSEGATSAAPASDGTTADAPKSDGGALTDIGPIADYQKAKQQLDLLIAQRIPLARNLRPAHPTMIALDAQIEKQKDLIETLRVQSVEALKTRSESIQIQITNLEGVIKEWEAKALDLSTRISEFDRIKTKSDRAKEEYETLLSDRNGVAVTKNVDQDSIMISQHATEGYSIKPGWGMIILMGFGGGLFVGLAILFCVDQLDDRIGSFIELQTHFAETILGQVPREQFLAEGSLLQPNDNRLALLEAFRSLRSSLIFFPVEGARPKTLVVTSALPNEGKTTISANLAITLAFSGARTLVVDADMRRGRLSHIFGITEGEGLSNILMNTAPWQKAVRQTAVENLSLISCGPPLRHPAEHLLGKIADQFLKDIYKEYDYVIFDSPPVTLLDDTLSLAPKVDGTMVVVRFGVSSVRTTRRTVELLAQRQTNILGLICNDVKLAESQYNYGYYQRDAIEKYNKEARATA